MELDAGLVTRCANVWLFKIVPEHSLLTKLKSRSGRAEDTQRRSVGEDAAGTGVAADHVSVGTPGAPGGLR
jgi:hypothetical protein